MNLTKLYKNRYEFYYTEDFKGDITRYGSKQKLMDKLNFWKFNG